MMDKKTFVLQKATIRSIGNQLGIEVNRLGDLLQFPEAGNETVTGEQPDGLKTVIETVLQPRNISSITLLFPDNSILWTTEITGKGQSVLYGDNMGEVSIKPMEKGEAINIFASYLNESTAASGKATLSLSMNALFVLLAINDYRRRVGLYHLLSHTVGDDPLTVTGIQKEIDRAVDHQDLRWLLPFFFEVTGYEKAIDLPLAIKELEESGFLNHGTEPGGSVEIACPGSHFLNELSRNHTFCGIQSYFYHKGALTVLRGAFLATDQSITFIEMDTEARFSSVAFDQVPKIINNLFSPGEDPGFAPREESDEKVEAASPFADKPAEEIMPEDQETATDANEPWECICGKINTGEFCGSCGKQRIPRTQTAIPSFCHHCGAPLAQI